MDFLHTVTPPHVNNHKFTLKNIQTFLNFLLVKNFI